MTILNESGIPDVLPPLHAVNDLAQRLPDVLIVVAGTQAEAHLVQCLPAAPSPNLPPFRRNQRVIFAVLDPDDPPQQGLLASRIVESAAGLRGTRARAARGGTSGGVARGRRRVRGQARSPQARPAGRGGESRCSTRSPRHPLHRPRRQCPRRPGEPLPQEEDLGPRGDRLSGEARRALRQPSKTRHRDVGLRWRPPRGAARWRTLIRVRAGSRRGALQDRGRGGRERTWVRDRGASAPRGRHGGGRDGPEPDLGGNGRRETRGHGSQDPHARRSRRHGPLRPGRGGGSRVADQRGRAGEVCVGGSGCPAGTA